MENESTNWFMMKASPREWEGKGKVSPKLWFPLCAHSRILVVTSQATEQIYVTNEEVMNSGAWHLMRVICTQKT